MPERRAECELKKLVNASRSILRVTAYSHDSRKSSFLRVAYSQLRALYDSRAWMDFLEKRVRGNSRKATRQSRQDGKLNFSPSDSSAMLKKRQKKKILNMHTEAINVALRTHCCVFKSHLSFILRTEGFL